MTTAKAARLRVRFAAPMPSLDERKGRGKALRSNLPHKRHADYIPDPRRQDPVAILEAQGETRLDSLVPRRYSLMLTSPFAFLRGSAAVMAADLARTPVTGLPVQACGDMHVANFGCFASAERNLIFGIKDFDETLPGPWEWDLKRLAVSAVVVGRFMGANRVLCDEAAHAIVRSYRKRMREYAEMGNLDVWYSRIDEAGIKAAVPAEAWAAAERIMAKARTRGHTQVLGKLAELVGDRYRIIEDKPLIVRETRTENGEPIANALSRTMELYADSLPDDRKAILARYRIADVARKTVGVGSAGTRCWIFLLTGNSTDDPLFLQYKEAQPSVLAPYVKASRWKCEGERVVMGQRIIQAAPDIFLGWGIQPKREGGAHFYMRQLRDTNGSAAFDPENIKKLPAYGKLCGWALALAHAKSGDAAAIAGYLGKSDGMDKAVARFAEAYADQTERDHATLAKAARQRRIRVAAPETAAE